MSAHTDNFENGYFWELYIDLEHQLRDFLEYVPYLPGNENTYSFKLLNLILSIGGHVDSALKEMIRYKGLTFDNDIENIRGRLQRWEDAFASKNKINNSDKVYMPETFAVFEKKYSLSTRNVEYKILPNRQPNHPFMSIKNAPSTGLWSISHGLKHDVAAALKEATLRNAWDALACAFILNVIHQPAMERLLEYNLLMHDTGWGFGQTAKAGGLKESDLAGWAEKGTEHSIYIETQLFVYKYKSFIRREKDVEKLCESLR